MIAGIRLGNRRILSACFPVKFPGIDDNPAKGSAVSADKFCGGVDDDISAVFDGPDQVGCAEGIVNDQGKAVPVSNFCDSIDIRDIAVWISKGF